VGKFVDTAGVTRLEGTFENGGSQPFVRVPLAFDTPNLVLTGIDAYVPAPGDHVLWINSYMSITTAWDGTTPHLNFTYSDLASEYVSFALDGADGVNADVHTTQAKVSMQGDLNWTFFDSFFPDATPLRLIVDDGNGGDPGSTQGEGELVLFIIPAA
jgi:hypothetical protein